MATREYKKASGLQSDRLYWPSNLVDTFDYLQIDIMDFQPSSTRTSSSVSEVDTATSATGFSIPGLQTAGNSLVTTTKTSLVTSNVILLPIPEELSYKDNPQWSDQAVGVIGKFGPQVAKEFIDGDVTALTEKIQTMAQAGSVGKLLDMVKKLGADPNAITQNINGKIANPYVEQVFGGVGLRQFDFSWKLVPRNEKEQASIHSIIRKLRESVLPNKSDKFDALDIDESSVGSGTERWLTVPKVFNLSWKYKGEQINSLPKIKTCVCKDVQVQYTPDNVWATHMVNNSSPYPVAYNLSLSFGETEIITSDLVSKGY